MNIGDVICIDLELKKKTRWVRFKSWLGSKSWFQKKTKKEWPIQEVVQWRKDMDESLRKAAETDRFYTEEFDDLPFSRLSDEAKEKIYKIVKKDITKQANEKCSIFKQPK